MLPVKGKNCRIPQEEKGYKMKKIVYYRREYIDKYRCIDYPCIDFVINDVPAFKQGDLFYFKKDNFNYLVLSKGNDGNYYI